MESIDVLTGQHVTIKYEPAGIVQRIAALLLDYLFMALYALALFFLFYYERDIYSYYSETTFYILLGIFTLPILCYHVLFETLMHGQTPGKSILKIRVTRIDGTPAGIGSYFLRWILLPIDVILYGGVGILLILFTRHHQRLGDLAAGTVVIRLSSLNTNFNLDEEYYEFNEDYEITYQEVELLTERQIQLISGILQEPANQNAVKNSISGLAQKVKDKLNVESSLDDREFLETIVRDYNYYVSSGI